MTTPFASATDPENSTHDIVLAQGAYTVGLDWCDGRGSHDPTGFRRGTLQGTSLKIYSGEAAHADLELPWKPLPQTDWSSGMGNLYHDQDTAGYFYSAGVDTQKPGQIILGGMPAWGSGNRDGYTYWPRESTEERAYIPLYGDSRYIAIAFTATAFAARYLNFVVRKYGSPSGNVTIGLYTDNLGSPATKVDEVTYSDVQRYWEEKATGFSAATAALSVATYWVVINATAAGDASNHYQILGRAFTADGSSKSSNSGDTYGNFNYKFFCRVLPEHKPCKYIFFDYKGSTFAVQQYDDTTAPRLLINGRQHVAAATGNSTTTVKIGSSTWTENQWAGCVVKFNAGTGSTQDKNYSMIISNTADTLTFYEVGVAPASGTEFSIIGSEIWTEATGPTDAAWTTGDRITDVLVVNGAVYFAMGDASRMRRMVRYNNSGTWTIVWDTASGGTPEAGQYTYLAYASETDKNYIYGFKGGVPATYARAEASNWTAGTGGAALVFKGTGAADAELAIGDAQERIRGVQVYGDQGLPYVLKEASIHFLYGGLPYRLAVAEMGNTSDPRNGYAHSAMGQYLWFSWQNGVMRLYGSIIDGMGVEGTDGGLPREYRGSYSDLVSYPGKMIAAHEGARTSATDGYSTLLVHNGAGRGGVGWCGILPVCHPDTDVKSYRITKLFIQSMYGTSTARLWYSRGSDIGYLPLATDPFDLPRLYPFCYQGQLITSWFTSGLYDITKLWKSIKLEVDANTSGTWEILVDYDIDDGNGWHELSTRISTAGTHEIDLSSTFSVASKRIRFRYWLSTAKSNVTPRIYGTIVTCLLRAPVRWATSGYVRLADASVQGDDTPDPMDTTDKLTALEAMIDSNLPVTVTARSPRLHNKYMMLDPDEYAPIELTEAQNNSGDPVTETGIYHIKLFELE